MTASARLLLVLLVAAGLGSIAAAAACVRKPPASPPSVLSGTASWYGPDFHGRRTSNREIFNMYELTAAHKSLPFGTRVMVTNLSNGRSVEVRINDRGPFVGDRVIDLSYAAARLLDMVGPGTVPVRLEILGPAPPVAPFPEAERFAVQVGAFLMRANAELLVRRLVDLHGFAGAALTMFQTETQTFYRVRVSASSEAEAQDIARRLAEAGFQVIILEE